jgi:hypothetical protein
MSRFGLQCIAFWVAVLPVLVLLEAVTVAPLSVMLACCSSNVPSWVARCRPTSTSSAGWCDDELGRAAMLVSLVSRAVEVSHVAACSSLSTYEAHYLAHLHRGSRTPRMNSVACVPAGAGLVQASKKIAGGSCETTHSHTAANPGIRRVREKCGSGCVNLRLLVSLCLLVVSSYKGSWADLLQQRLISLLSRLACSARETLSKLALERIVGEPSRRRRRARVARAMCSRGSLSADSGDRGSLENSFTAPMEPAV